MRIVHTAAADLTNDATKATATFRWLDLESTIEGDWGNRLKPIVDYQTKDTTDNKLFNLTIQELACTNSMDDVVASEEFHNLSTDPPLCAM